MMGEFCAFSIPLGKRIQLIHKYFVAACQTASFQKSNENIFRNKGCLENIATTDTAIIVSSSSTGKHKTQIKSNLKERNELLLK